MSKLLSRRDPAHDILVPFIRETQNLMQGALNQIDSNASCKIRPACDLGFPHDVIRLSGGFPTGCFVEWESNTPFIPVDTTVNIDTSSIFYLSDEISEVINKGHFDRFRQHIEESSYVFNLHKGNHFICFGVTKNDNKPVLVIHSNEKEFKYQRNGLVPTVGNWFYDDINVYENDGRYIRYISGRKAELFVKIAKMLEPFNIVRHQYFAEYLLQDLAKISSENHHHHYYMPSDKSIAIGCFLEKEGEELPIFSTHGEVIHLFTPSYGGKNIVTVSGEEKLIVPHGWGKTCDSGTQFVVDMGNKELFLNGTNYSIAPGVSLGNNPDLSVRLFSSNISNADSLFEQMKTVCPGKVIDEIYQLKSFSKHGYSNHFSRSFGER